MALDPDRRHKIIDFLSNQAGGKLHSFFVVHGYGAAYDELGKGWGRAKRVAHVLTIAERDGREEELLLAAEQLLPPEDRFPYGFEFSGGIIQRHDDGTTTFRPDRARLLPPPKPLGRLRHRLDDLLSDILVGEAMDLKQVETWIADLNAVVSDLEAHIGDRAPERLILGPTATDGNFLTERGRHRLQNAAERALAAVPRKNRAEGVDEQATVEPNTIAGGNPAIEGRERLDGPGGTGGGPEGDARRVFLVQGRNQVATNAVTDLLASVGLLVMSWEEAVRLAGGGSPYTLDIVQAGMRFAKATVVLFTPDDVACLDPRLESDTEPTDGILTGRARQNVVFEAGMALAFDDEHTVLVELGRVSGFSDLGGKHVLRLDGSAPKRQALLQRLRDIGCDVHMDGDRWLSAGDFPKAILPSIAYRLGADAASAEPSDSQPFDFQVRSLPSGFSPTPLDMWQPTGIKAVPSERTTDLALRCGVVLPDCVSGPAVTGEKTSRLTGEAREELLAGLLNDSQLTSWLDAHRYLFHLATIPSWQPYGFYNSGDTSELAVEPDDDTGAPGPISAVCRVHTGLFRSRATPHEPRAGLRLIADITFRLLEYDQYRRPSQTRHATTPPPVPAALSLAEVLDALVAAMSTVDIAQKAFAGLLHLDPPNEGLLICWLSGAGQGIDRLVDVSEFRVIRGSVAASEGYMRLALPLEPEATTLAPDTARRRAARGMLAEILERSGRRGYLERLDEL